MNQGKSRELITLINTFLYNEILKFKENLFKIVKI